MLNEKEVNLASLCRIRKYFIESYFKTDSYQKYPNVLFDFQYKALRSGYFDAYSHWVLFYGDEEKGKAWTTANKQKWEAFLNWFSKNEWHLDAQYKFSRKQY